MALCAGALLNWHLKPGAVRAQIGVEVEGPVGLRSLGHNSHTLGTGPDLQPELHIGDRGPSGKDSAADGHVGDQRRRIKVLAVHGRTYLESEVWRPARQTEG